jgi:hypothetical protein
MTVTSRATGMHKIRRIGALHTIFKSYLDVRLLGLSEWHSLAELRSKSTCLKRGDGWQ